MPASPSRIVVAALAFIVTPIASLVVHAEPDNAWVAHMDALASLLASTLPETVTRAKDADTDRVADEKLARSGRALAALAEQLPAMARAGDAGDADPTVPLLAHQLAVAANDMEHAHGELLRDDVAFVAATCIGCHTRSTRGVPRPRHELAPVSSTLPAWLRADTLAATRRFDEARVAYRAAVVDETFAEREPTLWERAVRRSLVVDVRVARDPNAALDTVDDVLNDPAGASLWKNAASWQRSLRAWANEDRAAHVDAFTDAAHRMSAAASLADTPSDDRAFIEYLRATADLHDALAHASLPPAQRAQAFAWLGEAYEHLRDVDVGSLYLLYDAACIEAAPHSALARRCFARFEQGTLTEQLGNGGGALDDDPAAFLGRMRELAR